MIHLADRSVTGGDNCKRNIPHKAAGIWIRQLSEGSQKPSVEVGASFHSIASQSRR